MKHICDSRVWRIVAIALLTTAAVRAYAAEPSPARAEEEPAVSGDDLQNLNRGDAAPAPERGESPAASQRDASPAQGSRTSAAPRPGAARADRLELDTTVVTGNRELPKVLYIVPWKKADLGDLPAQPFNTLLDEVLTPVDRDVFRREVTYYEAVSSGGDATGAASAPPAERSEK
jgi:hypothetical protein